MRRHFPASGDGGGTGDIQSFILSDVLALRNAFNALMTYKGPRRGHIKKIPRRIRTLVRNSNRLLEPDRSRRVVMYSDELPTSLVQQVAEIGDRALLAVEIFHHLCAAPATERR